jgi:hypothetical protein
MLREVLHLAQWRLGDMVREKSQFDVEELKRIENNTGCGPHTLMEKLTGFINDINSIIEKDGPQPVIPVSVFNEEEENEDV